VVELADIFRRYGPAYRARFGPHMLPSHLKAMRAIEQCRTPAFTEVPSTVWRQEWVMHCQPVGNGLNALKYLAPYIFRVAISNRRILKLEHDRVTFRYRASDTGTLRTCTLRAEEFIRRFLQHVLPRSFVKVRYYGFFSPGLRQRLAAIRRQLDTAAPTSDADYPASSAEAADAPPSLTPPQSFVRCPACGQAMRPRPLAHPERGQPP